MVRIQYAEETLLREIENRYPAPDAVSPRRISASPPSAASPSGAAAVAAVETAAAEAEAEQQQVVDFQPAAIAPVGGHAAQHSLTPVDSMESAEK